VRQDAGLAKSAYDKACNRGHIAGCTGLAYLYSKGDGVRRDVAKAAAMFEKGCQRGDARACSGLAQQARVTGKIDEAIPKFARACRLGYGRACFYEGAMHVKQKKSYARALQAFERACRGADYRGCLGAAHVLDGQLGVRSDPKRAGQLRSRGLSGLGFACDKKRHADACESLGDFYSGEYGTRNHNPGKAKTYYQKACTAGRKNACRR
jgi:uncharacterized protein